MNGEDLIRDEERRSYAAVFVLAAGLLLACTVWAIWQDAFSRHQWKQYKVEYYETAVARYQQRLSEARARIEADPKYVELTQELKQQRAALSDRETSARLRERERELEDIAVRVSETDLDLRIVKGKVEEAWYWYNKAVEEQRDPSRARATLDQLEKELEEKQSRYDQAVAKRDAARAAIEQLRGRAQEIEEALRPYSAEIGKLQAKLDGVSWSILGQRIVRVPMLDQTVLPGFERNNFDEWVDRVDRCRNCHAAIATDGFDDLPNPLRTHPDKEYYLGSHDPRHFGCTPCHAGQGASINSVAQAHGTVEFWEDPLLDVRDEIQSRCIKCHGSVQGLKGAEVAARGEQLFRDLGCTGCHLLEGFESLPKAGPSLERVAAKLRPEWLVEWIRDPHAFRPRTRMPSFFFSRDQAEAAAAYLLAASLPAAQRWLSTQPPSLVEAAAGEDAAGRGRQLTQSLGCRGCHGFEAGRSAASVAEGLDIAPNLARIGEKTDRAWIESWIRDPRGYLPSARMPRMRLGEGQSRAIAVYLASLGSPSSLPPDVALRERLSSVERIEQGKMLIRNYGCPGCHKIPGFNVETRVSVELSTFGSKPVEELFFGTRTDLPRNWRTWTENKIRTPRTYATERIVQAMPQYGLTGRDARALAVFLAAQTRAKIADRYRAVATPRRARLVRGRQLVSHYNCHGCHAFDGQQAAVRRYFGDEPENAPPILMGEGAKLQPEWFFDFLVKPVRLRPWLNIRMPTFDFDEQEATAIVDYFMALDGRETRPVIVSAAKDGSERVGPSGSVSAGGLDCFACHPAAAAEQVKPGLAAKRSLSDAEIRAWLEQQDESALVHAAAPTAAAAAEALRAYLQASEN